MHTVNRTSRKSTTGHIEKFNRSTTKKINRKKRGKKRKTVQHLPRQVYYNYYIY